MPLILWSLGAFFFAFIFLTGVLLALVLHGDAPAAILLDVLTKSFQYLSFMATGVASVALHRFQPGSAAPAIDLPLIDPTTEPK